jgi:hypothetical protein
MTSGATLRRLRLAGPRTLARTPGPAGRRALGFYRPPSLRGKTLHLLARSLVETPLGMPLETDVTLDAQIEAAARSVDAAQTVGVALMSSSRPHRWTAGLVAPTGRRAVSKIACLPDTALTDEIEILLAGMSGRGWRSPRVLSVDASRHLVVLDWEEGRDETDIRVAFRICQDLQQNGFVHGDLTPWNVLRTPTGHVVLDWETGRPGLSWPGHDFVHFCTKRAMLLDRRPASAVVRDLLHPNGLLTRLLAPVGLDPREATLNYLTRDHPGDESDVAVRYRAGMATALGASC